MVLRAIASTDFPLPHLREFLPTADFSRMRLAAEFPVPPLWRSR